METVPGLIDTLFPVVLLTVEVCGVVVGAVVGSTHSVLLAANIHCAMCVSLTVQLMNLKPVGKTQIND